MIPLSFKMILGFALICMIIISLMTVAAIINRPKQIQQLEAYEQKLTSISAHKVSEIIMLQVEMGRFIILRLHMKVLL